jgi:hypothetical protein
MFDLELNEDAKKWLRENYPGLIIGRENGIQVISGELEFDMVYEGERITDTYDIRIEMQSSQVSDLPKVSETGLRIKKTSQDRQTPPIDLHIYEHDWSACLCAKPAEAEHFPDGFSLPIFIEELVAPFFYAQSFVEKHGTWPWETYSHGDLGWLEWYMEQEDTTPEITTKFIEGLKSQPSWQQIRKELIKPDGVKGHHPCMCGKTPPRRYRDCHKKVLRGLWKLERDIKRFKISV